jgi:hypothetical protein
MILEFSFTASLLNNARGIKRGACPARGWTRIMGKALPVL